MKHQKKKGLFEVSRCRVKENAGAVASHLTHGHRCLMFSQLRHQRWAKNVIEDCKGIDSFGRFFVWPSICTHKPPSGFPIRSTLDCVFCCCWKMARVYLSFLFCLAQRQLPKWMAMEVLSINVWAFSPLTNSVRVWIVDKTRRKICVYISDPMSQPSVWLSCNIFIHFYLFIYFKPKKKNCRRG